MATRHAEPGEVIDLETWAQDLPDEQTKVIVKTDDMELVRLVIPAGKKISKHKVSGPIVVHCLTGELEFTVMGISRVLSSSQLLYLKPGEPHTLQANIDSVILLTIIFKV